MLERAAARKGRARRFAPSASCARLMSPLIVRRAQAGRKKEKCGGAARRRYRGSGSGFGRGNAPARFASAVILAMSAAAYCCSALGVVVIGSGRFESVMVSPFSPGGGVSVETYLPPRLAAQRPSPARSCTIMPRGWLVYITGIFWRKFYLPSHQSSRQSSALQGATIAPAEGRCHAACSKGKAAACHAACLLRGQIKLVVGKERISYPHVSPHI